jgi:hypothetical protein
MNIDLIILDILERRDPELVREIPLRNETELESGEEISLAEMKAKLRSLERDGHVVAVSNQDTGTKWGITDAGKMRLAKARN